MIFSLFRQILHKYRRTKMNPHQLAESYRPLLYHLGTNVSLYTNNLGTEPYLISIGNNVTVAADVKFVTHDVSVFNIARYLHRPENSLDKVGSIVIEDNAFIGAYSTLLPNCRIGKNSIVAACSVVTKQIPDNEVWGGVPAKFIMTADEYAKSVVTRSDDYPWMNPASMSRIELSDEELVRQRQKYFFENHSLYSV